MSDNHRLIHNEPCDCPIGVCIEGIEDDSHCINRLTGDVHTAPCDVCGDGYTWHQDGQCVRCAWLAKRAAAEAEQKCA
jgi:hypothetical protein